MILPEEKSDRREMVRTCLRYAAATGLAGMSAGLAIRGGGSAPGDRCGGGLPCRECAGLSDCRLPRAQEARQARAEREEV